MDTPERLAELWVTLGKRGIELGGVIAPPVHLIAHPNPSLNQAELEKVRSFVAAAIREALRQAGAHSVDSPTE